MARFANVNGVRGSDTFGAEDHFERKNKGGRGSIGLLGLSNDDGGMALLRVPGVIDLKAWNSVAINPLLEELLEVEPGSALERMTQVGGFNTLAGVFEKIAFDSAPKIRFTQLHSEHVQDPCALDVDLAAVEGVYVLYIIKIAPDHGQTSFGRIGMREGSGVAIHVPC